LAFCCIFCYAKLPAKNRITPCFRVDLGHCNTNVRRASRVNRDKNG
jgi:hypothetical protein